MMRGTLFAGCAAALAACVTNLDAQTAGFVVQLGRDTIAVERFTRSQDRLEGALLRRSPRTHLIRYVVELDAAGQPTGMTFSITTPGAAPQAAALRGGRVTFAP